jgi:hypothetical protein
MALKNLKNVVTGLGSKYQGANQGPSCCGSKASWENVFGGGDSPEPPPGCCGDMGDNYPSFGESIVDIYDPRMESSTWTCPPVDCRVELQFFPLGTNLENDLTATISININGVFTQMNWGAWNTFTINQGDQIFFQFNHTEGICNGAYIAVKNITCEQDFGNVCNLLFGDPQCIFCPQWDLSSIYERGPIALSPNYTNTTPQTQHIQVYAGFVFGDPFSFGVSYWNLNGITQGFLTQGQNSLGVVDVYLNPGDQMSIGVESLDGKCYDVEVVFENLTCGYSIGSISEILVNSGNC